MFAPEEEGEEEEEEAEEEEEEEERREAAEHCQLSGSSGQLGAASRCKKLPIIPR